MKKMLILLLMLCSITLIGCKVTETKEDSGKLKVALLIAGELGDKSFFDSAQRGMELVKEELDCEVTTIEMSKNQRLWAGYLEDVSEGDWDLIISGPFVVTELIEEIAPDYPEKRYVLFDSVVNYQKYGLENVYCMTYKQNEVSYLAGMISAMRSETDRVGFLGGMNFTVINDFLVGYIDGIKSVNKNAKLEIGYVGDFVNVNKAYKISKDQYGKGVDIIFAAAGAASNGTFNAGKDLEKLAIGVDSDQAAIISETDKTKARLIVSSAMKNIDNSIFRAVKLFKEDKLKFGVPESLGLKEGAVGVVKDDLTANEKSKIERAETKIINGTIKVKTAFGMSEKDFEKEKSSLR